MKFFLSNTELKANLEAAQESMKHANAKLAELENAAEDIKAKDEQIANQTMKIAELEEQKEELSNSLKDVKADLKAKNTQLEKELVEQKEATAKAENYTHAKAKEIVASVGHKENIVPQKEEGGKKELSREEFNKLDAKEKSLFCIEGGKIK